MRKSGAQAPMSRVETDTYINDRYAAIEDRLSVSQCMRMFNASLFASFAQGPQRCVWRS